MCSSVASVSSDGAAWALARNSRPLRSRPRWSGAVALVSSGVLLENGTQLVKAKACISALSCSRAASMSPSGSQATASSDHGNSALVILTAACLSSGCLELGQKADVVSALTPASRPPVLETPLKNSSPQCMAIKAWLSPTSADACTGTKMAPRLDVTCTRSPSLSSLRAMSCACICTDGSATWPNRRPSVPVRVMPCHWSRSRPVVSENGKRDSRGSATG